MIESFENLIPRSRAELHMSASEHTIRDRIRERQLSGLVLTEGHRGEGSYLIEGVLMEHNIRIESWKSVNPYVFDPSSPVERTRFVGTVDKKPIGGLEVQLLKTKLLDPLREINERKEREAALAKKKNNDLF